MVTSLRYEHLPEPPNLGIRLAHWEDKLSCTVEVDGRDVEMISVRLDTTVGPSRYPTWLFLRPERGLTTLLHTCGEGLGWREVGEGAPDLTIQSSSSPHGYLTFTCLRCASVHSMRPDGTIDWRETSDAA